MQTIRIRSIAVAVLLTLVAPVTRAADLFEDFETWEYAGTATEPVSFSTNGWDARNVRVAATNWLGSVGTAVWLHINGEPHLRTPLLTNGFGHISFYVANSAANTEYPFRLEMSTDGDAWTVLTGYTNTTTRPNYIALTFQTHVYDDVFLRFAGEEPITGSGRLGINNVRITEAPAKVGISSLQTDPPIVYVNDTPAIEAVIIPSALASNITASVIYSSATSNGTNTMTHMGGNLWRTLDPLPAQTLEDVTVHYVVQAVFSGTNALSPASATSAYVIAKVDFETDYAINSMSVIGDTTASMFLIGHYRWQGVLSLPAATEQSSFRFEGVRSSDGVTNRWGDPAPVSDTLIAHGTAITGATAITIGPLPAGQIGFLFNEQTGAYEINDVAFHNFEAWIGADFTGTHESNGWIVASGRIVSDSRTRGRSAILSPLSGAHLRSPERTHGIGAVSFWLRHGDEEADPISECELQVSVTGGETPGEWVTVTNVWVASPAFNRIEIPFNNRAYRYARLIRTGASAEIIVDDITIASPGAGVALAALTHTPASPTVNDTVSISAEINAFRGAALTNVTAGWRTAGDGPFTHIPMSNSAGSVWTTTVDIPAGRGNAPDGRGAGEVEYYVQADFTGYLAGEGSPAFLPPQGAANPDSFTIQAAYVVFTNVAHVPVSPDVGTTFAVSADLLTFAGADPPQATLHYRTGTTGAYASAAMALSGSNTYTLSGIAVPSTPGFPVQYYIRATFEGPSALSPTHYPAGGAATPIVVLARAPDPLSAFDAMSIVSSEFTGTLRQTGDYRWLGFLTLAAPALNPGFTLQGTGTNTVTWGDNSAAGVVPPRYGTAVPGQAPITLGGTYSNRFILVFNEATGRYHLQAVHVQDFMAFSPYSTFTPGVPVVTNGWTLMNATVFNAPASFDGNTLQIGGTHAFAATNSYVLSPPFSGGVGSIGFRYRNLDETGSRPGHLAVQMRSAANPGWITLSSLTNILTAEYLYFETPYTHATDAGAVEVRVLWTAAANPGAAPIGIDDLYIESLGAYAAISNVAHAPESPTAADPVFISALITPYRGAIITNAAAGWRTAGDGAFTLIPMSKGTGDLWTTVAGVPPGKGNAPDGLGAGDVEYHVHADFAGYQTGIDNPPFLPAKNAGDLTRFTIQPARIEISNVTHVPISPDTASTLEISAEVQTFAGAQIQRAAVHHRTGTTGAFTETIMNSAGGNMFTAGLTAPAHPGTPIHYYIRVAFTGPSAQSPVFSPAGGATTPIVVLARAPDPLSAFTAMSIVSSEFTGTLRQTGDYRWLGFLTLAAPALNPGFTLQGTGTNTVTWGDNSAAGVVPPRYGTAVPGQAPITLGGTYSNRFILVFNEATGRYRLQAVRVQDFTAFSPYSTFTPGVPVVTNGWTLMNATVFNAPASFDGNTLQIGGTHAFAATNSYVLSPPFSGGAGSIGFRYRNLDETGSRPGHLAVQTRTAVNPGWSTLSSLTNILTAEYLHFETPYASNADAIEVRVLWTAAANPGAAPIAVDNLYVEYLDVYATVSDITHIPESPSITNTVVIQADISPLNGAVGLGATTWFRLGTQGYFLPAAMTHTVGNTFVTDPPIPRTEAGIVQYYIDVTFDNPHGDGPFHVYAPAGGDSTPLAYTNRDEFAATIEFLNSEGLVSGSAWANQSTTSGWYLHQAAVRSQNWLPATGEGAGWLNAISAPGGYIQSPWLPFGIGALSISNRVRADNAEYRIEISPDGNLWTAVATQTVNYTDWQAVKLPLNIENGVFLRLFNNYSFSSGAPLGFDSIYITYPLANAAITNVAFHPRYPAGTDPVHITCEILSITEFSPAIDITARVYHRLPPSSTWLPPIEMTADGRHFITATPLPAYAAGTRVEYYVEATFRGYRTYHSFSPVNSPANPNVAPYTYTTRQYASSYSALEIGTDGDPFGMIRIGDRMWEGILHYITPETEPEFNIIGYDFYDGTHVIAGPSPAWGDNDQTRPRLPLSGMMQPGGIAVVIPEIAQGQYVLRFDEATRVYSLQRVAYQNFDTWPASDTLFEESYDAAEVKQYPQDFDLAAHWPVSVPLVQSAYFDTDWNNVQAYPPDPPVTFGDQAGSQSEGFYRYTDGAVVTQRVGHALMLRNSAFSGTVESFYELAPQSVGTFSFDVRCANPFAFQPSIYTNLIHTNILITAEMQTLDIPVNSSGDSLGFAYKSIIGHYADPGNYFELRVVQISNTQRQFQLWERRGGTLNLRGSSSDIPGGITVNDTFSLLLFRGSTLWQIRGFHNTTRVINTTALPLPSTGYGFGANGLDASLVLHNISVYSVTNEMFNHEDQRFLEYFPTVGAPPAGWTNPDGVWSVTNGALRRAGYTGPPLGLDVQFKPHGSVTWSQIGTHSNLTHSTYQRIHHTLQNATNGFMRIRHTAGNGSLVIDNVRKDSWRGETLATADGWLATNAWVTGGKIASGLELRRSRALAGAGQYIRSPSFSDGAAVISFWYKSITGPAQPLVFDIQYSPIGMPNEWSTLRTVTNNPLSWTLLSHSIDYTLRPSIGRIRIRNISVNNEAGMVIDNIEISGQPPINDFTWWAYNVLVTSKQTDKLANVPGQVKGAYLNNSPTTGTGGYAYTNYSPFIQSAWLPDGIGEISFLYRGWDGTPSSIEILVADTTNRALPDAGWTLLDTVSVTSTVFRTYSRYFYDTTSRFVRFRVNTGAGSIGRAAMDNITISAPFASDLKMKNLRLDPEIPLFNESVFVAVDIYDLFFNPVITSVKLLHTQGTNNWGQYPSPVIRNMTLTRATNGVYTYRSIDPIPGIPLDQVMQYQVQAEFDGFFSHIASPKRYYSFENPYHYWPVDRNRDQATPTPYYVALSCLPGQVWINEFNVADAFWGPLATQYIEIAGVSDVNIGNWSVEVINTDFSTNASYTIPNPPGGTRLGGTDYGFYVLGETNLPTGVVDLALNQRLPDRGGLQLKRSMGAIMQQVAYDTGWPDPSEGGGQNMTNSQRFVYAGADSTFGDYSLSLTSDTPGSNMTDFVWVDYEGYSIGTTNFNQELIPWPTNTPSEGPNPYTGPVQVSSFWSETDRLYFQISTESANLAPTPWYTTNLMTNVTWHAAPDPQVNPDGVNYTVSCTRITNAPMVFYTITVTGTE